MIMTIDIGGTKTLWALWERGCLLEQGRQPTASIKNFTGFLDGKIQGRKVEAMCFALAGPVTDNRLTLTNTGQVIDLDRVREYFAEIPHMAFLNDLEALAHSVDHLQGTQMTCFRRGACEGQDAGSGECLPAGAKAVLSVGTGLGVAAVTREGIVLPSEGGHVDFAPRTGEQEKILQKLKQKYGGHVSYERLLSGQGLSNLYSIISGKGETDPAKITEEAMVGAEQALETFRLFTEILAAACGNFALVFMASGGIYLGGGMIPKILPLLDRDLFEAAFLDKGRFSSYLKNLPVYAILDETAPSLGAATYSEALTDSKTGL